MEVSSLYNAKYIEILSYVSQVGYPIEMKYKIDILFIGQIRYLYRSEIDLQATQVFCIDLTIIKIG